MISILAPLLAASAAAPTFKPVTEEMRLKFPLMLFRCEGRTPGKSKQFLKVIILLNEKYGGKENLFILIPSPNADSEDFTAITDRISSYADIDQKGGVAGTILKPDDKYGVQFTYQLHYRPNPPGPGRADLSVSEITGVLSRTDGSSVRQCSLGWI